MPSFERPELILVSQAPPLPRAAFHLGPEQWQAVASVLAFPRASERPLSVRCTENRIVLPRCWCTELWKPNTWGVALRNSYHVDPGFTNLADLKKWKAAAGCYVQHADPAALRPWIYLPGYGCWNQTISMGIYAHQTFGRMPLNKSCSDANCIMQKRIRNWLSTRWVPLR